MTLLRKDLLSIQIQKADLAKISGSVRLRATPVTIGLIKRFFCFFVVLIYIHSQCAVQFSVAVPDLAIYAGANCVTKIKFILYCNFLVASISLLYKKWE